MRDYTYIKDFQKLGFGMFVHFGVYSTQSCAEWGVRTHPLGYRGYFTCIKDFKIKETWAKELVATAKNAGCKYITLTTRHHEGFSLYDTCGLSDFDAPHSPTGRDLVREFVDECNKEGIIPFFYHTCFDWHYEKKYLDSIGRYDEICFRDQPDYERFFATSGYFDFWKKSLEILCTRYGKIGGFWFDGTWACPGANWPLDEVYGMIRKYQPTAMVINNTGLDALGEVGHPEIDSVTFERGKPAITRCTDRPRAGEMCQTLNQHWGHVDDDINYKSINELITNLVDCRANNCNMLLNVGPTKDGSIEPIEKCIFEKIGKWVKVNKDFIYDIKACEDIQTKNCLLVKDDDYYYAIIKDVPMQADPNVQRLQTMGQVWIEKEILSAEWLDDGSKINFNKNEFKVDAFVLSKCFCARVAKLTLKD